MLHIIINAIGKERCVHTQKIQQEYIKRIPWKIKINEYNLESKKADISIIKKTEAAALNPIDTKSKSVIVLDENGISMNSIDFSKIFSDNLASGINNIYFLIGGAYGHCESLLKNPLYKKISLSQLTFPHKLARTILLEQIYRAYTLLNSHPYHKN